MKFINKYLIIILVLISFSEINAQIDLKKNLTGNLLVDSKILSENNQLKELPEIMPQSISKKSPMLAGLFSFILPGAGEIYAEEYLKGAIFLIVEAAAITTAIIYDGKGDDKTDEFQNYADDYTNPEHNWSVVRYAEWLIQYELGGEDPGIIISNDESLPPWQRVNWSVLNANEHGSHKLPRHGDQQYYELIGKYYQYSAGWNDYNSGAANVNMSPNFHFYSGMRGKANDLYNIASKAVILIYINHFLSVVDAVWSTVQYNKDISLKVRLEELNMADHIEWIPTLNISYNF